MTASRFLRDLRRGGRRRGSALVFVLFFGIAAMALVVMLFTATTTNMKAEHETHRQHGLQSVVRAGLATAVNEINLFRKSPSAFPNTNNDGPGAITGGTGFPGVPVYENANGTGPVLGFYRATVDPATNVLTVIAAWPNFANPQQIAAGRVVLGRNNRVFPMNPLSVVGDLKRNGTDPNIEANGNNVEISGNDQVGDGFNVPGMEVNLSGSDLADAQAGMSGADITGVDQYGNPASGSATILNQGNTVMDETVLTKIAQQINSYVAAHPITNANVKSLKAAITQIDGDAITSGGDLKNGKSITLPESNDQVYLLTDQMEITGTLKGSGTLIVSQNFKIKGTLEWKGDVIVQSASGTVTMDILSGANTRVYHKPNGDPGLLVVQSWDLNTGADANLIVRSGGGQTGNDASSFQVHGGLFVLSDHSSDFDVKNGAGITVYGIMGLLGTDIDVSLTGGAKIQVDGSLVVAVPPGNDSKGLVNLALGGHTKLNWHSDNFTTTQTAFASFIDPNDEILPLRIIGYWEPPVRGSTGALAEQAAALQSGTYAYTGQ